MADSGNDDLIINKIIRDMSYEKDDLYDTESSDYDTEPYVYIEGNYFKKAEIDRLMKSSCPQDVKVLNQLITKMIVSDCSLAFEYLMENGYNASIPINDKGQTAVHIAFYEEYRQNKHRHHTRKIVDICEVLVRFVNDWLVKKSVIITPVDCNGLNYLHIACFLYDHKPRSNNEANLITRCLKYKVDVNAQFRDPEGYYGNFTPLHFAAINPFDCSADIVKQLLTHNSEVNTKDSLGRTPLHLACQTYKNESEFVKCNSEKVLSSFETGKMATSIFERPDSLYMKSVEIIKLLVKFGADINLRDDNGNTPLHTIFPEKYGELARINMSVVWHERFISLIEITMKFAYFWKEGVDMTLSNENGDTILHLITRNLKDYSKLTIQFYANEKFCNENSKNSLRDIMNFYNNENYHFEMIKRIFDLKQEVDVNARNKKGITPIQWAVEAIDPEIVKLLLRHGANFDHLNFEFTDDMFFDCSNKIPDFKTKKKLLAIIELSIENSSLSPEMNMKIFKFFIHDDSKNKYCYPCSRTAMCIYESNECIEQYLLSYKKLTCLNSLHLAQFYSKIFFGGFYIDEKVKEMIAKEILDREDSMYSMDEVEYMTSKLQKELSIIKSIKITDNLSLYDLMIRHPYNVPYNLIKNFDYSLLKDLKSYTEIVESHLIKTVLRRHVRNICGDSIKIVFSSLPDLCYEVILDYLSNTDIVKVYSVINSLV